MTGAPGVEFNKSVSILLTDYRGSLSSLISLYVSSSILLLVMSCWTRRVGTGIVLWAAYLFLCLFISSLIPFVHPLPAPAVLIGLNPLLALVIAYFTFIRGYQFGDSEIKSRLLGSIPFMILFTGTFVLLIEEYVACYRVS